MAVIPLARRRAAHPGRGSLLHRERFLSNLDDSHSRSLIESQTTTRFPAGNLTPRAKAANPLNPAFDRDLKATKQSNLR
jgi:hypothetical protein